MAIYTTAESLRIFPLPSGKPVYLISKLAPSVYKENKDFTVLFTASTGQIKQCGRSDTWIY